MAAFGDRFGFSRDHQPDSLAWVARAEVALPLGGLNGSAAVEQQKLPLMPWKRDVCVELSAPLDSLEVAKAQMRLVVV
jgi:hypothetical protein